MPRVTVTLVKDRGLFGKTVVHDELEGQRRVRGHRRSGKLRVHRIGQREHDRGPMAFDAVPIRPQETPRDPQVLHKKRCDFSCTRIGAS